jgi:hypothetical protein
MAGRLEGEQGVKRGSNSEDARTGAGNPGQNSSFELAFAEGEKNPMRGTAS